MKGLALAASLAVLLSGFAPWSWCIAAAALVSRIALKLRLDRVLRLTSRDLWLLPLWDLASLGVFAASFRSAGVTWRGYRYRVNQKGLLTQVQDQ